MNEKLRKLVTSMYGKELSEIRVSAEEINIYFGDGTYIDVIDKDENYTAIIKVYFNKK